jgi:hypothetical protein
MMQYYDLQKNWRKVKRYINEPEVQAVLVRDFNKFTFGRWGNEFKPGLYVVRAFRTVGLAI